MKLLENMHVLVVGASGDIGMAMVERFLAEGAHVTATARNRPERLASLNVPALRVLVMDVTSTDSVAAAAAALPADPQLNAVVYCAGITRDGLLLGMEEADWAELLDVNLTGAFRVARAFGKILFRRRCGKMLFLSSTAAVHCGRGQAAYAASKAGLEAMVKALAKEMAPRNVMVNALAPGAVESRMTQDVMTLGREEVLKRIALGRLATPTEIAALAAHLLSPGVTYLTGETIRLDGAFG
jgi:3-oxoacyl-[acyl-carrier protein] reductase